MKNKKSAVTLIIGALVLTSLTGCGAVFQSSQNTPLTQLEVRQLQTQDFDTTDTKLVMKSMMNTLQDEGYLISNAVMDLGLLSAEKNINIENKTRAVLLSALIGKEARWDKHETLQVCTNVTPFGTKTRVRVNFQIKTLDNLGCPKEVITVTDPTLYQLFFEKVSKGIFIQEQDI